MSGHSHWHSIKHKKSITDAKKSKFFSKVTREIVLAAREGGNKPDFNSKLRLAIEKARSVNMPADNIEKAIKRGAGEDQDEVLEQFLFEAYGPGNSAILIEGITDNKNRALGEIKQILHQNNGKMVAEGAIRWMFERKGVIVIAGGTTPDISSILLAINNEQKTISRESLELAAIEAGAQDFSWHDDFLDIYARPEDSEGVKKALEEKGYKIDSISLDWVAKETMELPENEEKKCEELFEALDESESVQEIYSNLKD